MARSTVAVRFVGDAVSLRTTLAQVDTEAGKVGSKLADTGKKIAAGLAVGAAGMVALGAEVLNTGAKLEAWRTKTNTVFEGQADDVRRWADQNNEAFGLTDDALAGLAASFGDLLKPMGFTADEAAGMSKDVVGLAGALSAWSGGQIDASGAADKLAAAMLGEREGLKELGIAISQADVDARLAAKGQSELTGKAREMAEAVATQELIFEKSTDAQKAWAAGGNEALEAQNRLKASFGEIRERIATGLLPVVAALGSAFADGLLPAFEGVISVGQSMASWLGEHQPVLIGLGVAITTIVVPALVAWAAAAATAAAATLAAMAPVIAIGAALGALVAGIVYAYQNWDTFRNSVQAVADVLTGVLWPALQTVVGFIVGTLIPTIVAIVTKFVEWHLKVAEVAAGIISWVSQVVAKVVEVGAGIASAIAGIVSKFVEWHAKAVEIATGVITAFQRVVSFIAGMPATIGKAASSAWNALKTGLKEAIDWIIKQIDRALGPLDELVGGLGKVVGGAGKVLGKIPGLASGGTAFAGKLHVVGEQGPELFVPGVTGTILPNRFLSAVIPEVFRRIADMAHGALRIASSSPSPSVSALGGSGSLGGFSDAYLRTLATGFTENDTPTAEEQRALDIRRARGLPSTAEMTPEQIKANLAENWRLQRDGTAGVAEAIRSAWGIDPSGNVIGSLVAAAQQAVAQLPPQVQLIVQGSLIHERDIPDLIRQELERVFQRNGFALNF